MFRDFREAEDGSVIDTDLCVIGAGAAGITMAKELADTEREVLLVESGEHVPEGATLALYKGVNVGCPYPPLESARLRYFGGSTNHWDGHCRPLDAIDFEKWDWVPYSGWPITLADLEPFYARAQRICELGPYDYDPEHIASPDLIPFNPERLVNRIWQYSPPTRFGEHYRSELEQAHNIGVLLNANVVEIEANETASSVTGLRIKALEGKTGRICANTYVLATGGIENARILLASDSVMKNGLGNGNDLVGRFFMEHPHALIAYAVPGVEVARLAPYYEGTQAKLRDGSAIIQSKAGLSFDLQRRERLLNACTEIGWGHDRSVGYLALHKIVHDAERGLMPDRFGEAVLDVVTDLDHVVGGVYRWAQHQRYFWFGANAEQVPNPLSRVTLDRSRDALGMRRSRLDWRVTEQDKAGARHVCQILAEELARLDVARVRMDDWLLEENNHWDGLGPRYHHMGTTRMSDDPKTGVVDKDCRVHGIANLYVAGSSVFTTSGYANPTLTIVALASRLAHHLMARRS